MMDQITCNSNRFYVYGLFRQDKKDGDDGLFYIGKGTRDRFSKHREEAKRTWGLPNIKSVKTRVIHSLWNKGLDYTEKVLWDNLDEQDAFDIEIELISIYGRIDEGGILANMTDGGDGICGREPWNKGIPRTQEVKDKIRIALTGRKFPDEINKKKGRKGRVGNNKGIKQTEESNQKRRIALLGKPCPSRGRPFTEERRDKLSKALKGIKRSDEFRQKQRIRMIGNRNNVGRKLSEETKKKISEGNKGKIISTETRIKQSMARKGYVPWNKGIRNGER